MDVAASPQPGRVTVARLPKRSAVLGVSLILMIGGMQLTNVEFSISWLLRIVVCMTVLVRISQIELAIENGTLMVTNFFRTIHVPVNDVEVAPSQPRVGYLELIGSDGQKIQVGAAPSWGQDLDVLSGYLNRELAQRRNR